MRLRISVPGPETIRAPSSTLSRKRNRDCSPCPVTPFTRFFTNPFRSKKTIFTPYNKNVYPLPPDAARNPCPLGPTPEGVRLLDALTKTPPPRRSYDRHARIEDPSHIQALVEDKR